MPATTNAGAALIASIHAALVTRVGNDADYADVKVQLVPSGATGLDEYLVLIRPPDGAISAVQDWAAMGQGRRDEILTIQSQLGVKVDGKSHADSATFQAAMDRAAGLLQHVIAELRDNRHDAGTSQTVQARVSSYEHQPRETDSGWGVVTNFEISADVRVS